MSRRVYNPTADRFEQHNTDCQCPICYEKRRQRKRALGVKLAEQGKRRPGKKAIQTAIRMFDPN